MKTITATILALAIASAMSSGAFAGKCKKGYAYDADEGKCVKIYKGSH